MTRKVHDRLFDNIANFQALRTAARKAIKGKRNKPAPAAFMANLETEILRLERELQDGTYRPGGYVTIFIKDPKSRMVSAAPFRDRVVHHALCAVIEPIFERGFIFDSYANRSGKGTHRAVTRYEKFRDRFAHLLRCDIHRYFPAIDHDILKRDVRRRVGCERTLGLIDTIIDGSNPQEPVYIHYPGDDLLTPFERKRGLPIGNLTSQFFANLYLDGLDHFANEKLKVKGYVRYVDDFALFHDDPATLDHWRQRIGVFLQGRRLSLHAHKTRVQATREPAPFLATCCILVIGAFPRITCGGFGIVCAGCAIGCAPERHRQRRSSKEWARGSPMPLTQAPGVSETRFSRARHSIQPRNRTSVMAQWPQAEAWPVPCCLRVLRGGSWNNNQRNLRSANRNRNNSNNRNNNIGFRLARTPLSQSRCVHGRTGRATEGVQDRP